MTEKVKLATYTKPLALEELDLEVAEGVYEVDLDLIEEPGVVAPRWLVEEMKDPGQHTPILIRFPRDDEATDTQFKIVHGRRRVAALIEADRTTVKARVEEYMDENREAYLTLSENLHRSRNPAAEARAVAHLLNEGMTPEEIGKAVHIDLPTIKELAKLHGELHPDAFRKLESGQIALSAAKRMAKLPQDAQATLAQEERIRIKDVEAAKRQQHLDVFATLDRVPVRAYNSDAELAQMVEAAAMKFSGDPRRILIDAAAILRGKGGQG